MSAQGSSERFQRQRDFYWLEVLFPRSIMYSLLHYMTEYIMSHEFDTCEAHMIIEWQDNDCILCMYVFEIRKTLNEHIGIHI